MSPPRRHSSRFKRRLITIWPTKPPPRRKSRPRKTRLRPILPAAAAAKKRRCGCEEASCGCEPSCGCDGGCGCDDGCCLLGDCCLGDPCTLKGCSIPAACDHNFGGWIAVGYYSDNDRLVDPSVRPVGFNDNPDQLNLDQVWLYAEKVADSRRLLRPTGVTASTSSTASTPRRRKPSATTTASGTSRSTTASTAGPCRRPTPKSPSATGA